MFCKAARDRKKVKCSHCSLCGEHFLIGNLLMTNHQKLQLFQSHDVSSQYVFHVAQKYQS